MGCVCMYRLVCMHVGPELCVCIQTFLSRLLVEFALGQNGETLSGSNYSFCGQQTKESGYEVSLISVFHLYKEYLLALRILSFRSDACPTK